jgi:hypothetical protein
MVAIVAVLFRLFLLLELVKQAKGQADKGIRSAMEATTEIDMSVEGRSFWRASLRRKQLSELLRLARSSRAVNSSGIR